jgi:hypothetical protein
MFVARFMLPGCVLVWDVTAPDRRKKMVGEKEEGERN